MANGMSEKTSETMYPRSSVRKIVAITAVVFTIVGMILYAWLF